MLELIEQSEREAAYNIAYILAWRGEADRAFEWLDKAQEYRDGGLSHIVVDPKLSVRAGHDIARTVKYRLLDNFEDVTRVIIHVDPEPKIHDEDRPA